VSRLFPELLTVHLAADPGVAALRARGWPARCRVRVVLSNHFVRYALVPWSRSLSDPAEEEAYVRHHFVRIHGERAKAWALRWSEDSADAPRLASAVDATLLDEIKASFPPGGKARLVSIQPALMAAANHARRALPDSGAWLVVAETDRACVALYGHGGWRAVQNAKGPWLPTLEREWHRAPPGAPRVALLVGARPEAAAGWTFREIAA